MAAVYYGHDRHLALFHCRSDQQFDLERIGQLLDTSRRIAKMCHDELELTLNAGYGTVNPFNAPPDMIQVFDKNLFQSEIPPYTMMTNGGERTWAIEFHAKDFVDKLVQDRPNSVKIESITSWDDNAKPQQARPIFGLVTGNGPDSGMALWRHLNRGVAGGLGKDFRGDLDFPQVVVRSIPEMGLSMELAPREEDTWHHLSKAIIGLCKDGCTHIALACHTTHYFTKQIRAICGDKAQFVSMAQVAIDYIHSHQIKDLTLMGIPYVSDLGEWSAYKALRQIPARVLGKKAREPMLELGYLIKRIQNDKDRRKALNKLHHVLRAGVGDQSEHVLIALTEISVLLEHFPKQQNKIGRYYIIDPLKLYGEALAAHFLNQ